MMDNLYPQGPLPASVEVLLASADSVKVIPQLPTCATALVKGKLTLLLGDMYVKAPDNVKVAMLRHEAWHYCAGHLIRRGDRQPMPWNACADAVIHNSLLPDWQILKEYGGIITFDMLPDKDGGTIFPCPPEVAYERLPTRHDGSDSCGSMTHGEHDQSPASIAKHVGTASRIIGRDKELARAMGGTEQGTGQPTPEATPPPEWIRKVITYLTDDAARSCRRRGWRRESRLYPDLLPGRVRTVGVGPLILLDASGSTHRLMGEFLGAICGTPELSGAEVIVFDVGWSRVLPATDGPAIAGEIARRGGGTSIKATGEACRQPGRSVVWLTDGESGDGWPYPHDTVEVWAIVGEASPPSGVVVRVGQNA